MVSTLLRLLPLLAATAVAQEIHVVTPQPISASAWSTIEFAGPGLGTASSVTLQGPSGSSAVPATVLARSSESLQVAADLAALPVGLYGARVSFQDGSAAELRRAFELSRSPELLLSGPAAASAPDPFSGLSTQSATEYLLDLPAGEGTRFTALGFFLAPGSPAPVGDVVIRWRPATATQFTTTALGGAESDWLVLYHGPFPAPTADGEIVFSGWTFIVLRAGERLHLSLCHTAPSASGLRLVQRPVAVRTARRGVDDGHPLPPQEWSGSIPVRRSYPATAPVLRLYYRGLPVSANFEASSTRVAMGSTVQFLNRSSANATRLAWDLDGDGATDATGAAAARRYDRPGVYTVVLTAGDGFAEDAETKVDLLDVYDPAALPPERWVIR